MQVSILKQITIILAENWECMGCLHKTIFMQLWRINFGRFQNPLNLKSLMWSFARTFELCWRLVGYFRTLLVSYGVQRSLFRSQIMKTLHFFQANSRHIFNVLDVNLGSNNGNFFALPPGNPSRRRERKKRKVTAEREDERRVRGGGRGEGWYLQFSGSPTILFIGLSLWVVDFGLN